MLGGQSSLQSPPPLTLASSLLYMTAAQDGFPSHMNAFINAFPPDLLQPDRRMMNRMETPRPADPAGRKHESEQVLQGERVGEREEGWDSDRDRECPPLHLRDGAVKRCLPSDGLIPHSLPPGSTGPGL